MAQRSISKNLIIDDAKKQVFCDIESASANEIQLVGIYTGQGYKLNPEVKGGDSRKKEYYLDMCKTEQQKKDFEAICKGTKKINGKKGFFVAKSWLLEELGKKDEKNEK